MLALGYQFNTILKIVPFVHLPNFSKIGLENVFVLCFAHNFSFHESHDHTWTPYVYIMA